MEKGKIAVSDSVLAVVSKVKVTKGARASILRRRQRLTLSDVTAAIGVHEHGVSEMERGKRDVSEAYSEFLLRPYQRDEK